MMIDCHTHLTGLKTDEFERQVRAAKSLGTAAFIEVVGKAEQAPRAVAMANARDDFYCGLAGHPMSVEAYDRGRDLPVFRRLIRDNKKVVCVGECGLDYWHQPTPPARVERQKELFRDMLRLAREFGLPLNLHAWRPGVEDVLVMLREEKAYEVGGMIHQFGGNADQARQYMDMGFYVSVGVFIQHPRADRLRSVLKDIPLGQMVLDSDAPGARLERVGDSTEPYPYDMDKQCEARVLRYVCDKLAEVKGTPVDLVEAVTTHNARRLFRITG